MIPSEDWFYRQRLKMVDNQIIKRGLQDPRVLAVMRQVPRHLFVPLSEQILSYNDNALPIPCGQTISQPYMVAVMADSLSLKGDETVLEVGTGSGYQAAVLAGLCKRVITLERIGDLAVKAVQKLSEMGYYNIEVQQSDGSIGWPDEAPYQGILVTAGAPQVPEPLLEQLTEGGRLVIPVGPRSEQKLQLWIRQGQSFTCRDLMAVSFIPLRGSLGWKDEEWSEKKWLNYFKGFS